MQFSQQLLLALAAALIGSTSHAASDATTTFGNHREGWKGAGSATRIDRSGGEGTESLRTKIVDFGVSFSNKRNDSFVGDLTALGAIEFSIDVNAYGIQFDGRDVTRELVLELRDYDNPAEFMPYTSVWYDLGTLTPKSGWQTLSVTIADTTSNVLPAGWGGYGAEDPVTYEPVLPEGRTFANVLAGIDEIVFTSFVPGYFYGFTSFDVAVDNISIRQVTAPVPEPAAGGLLAAGLGLLAWRLRRTKSGRPTA
jgi:hypothetical protein